MRKFVKKYWIGLLVYTILLIIFPHAVIGISVVLVAFPLSYYIWRFLGFDKLSCSSNDDDDDLTMMMLYHHYRNKHKN